MFRLDLIILSSADQADALPTKLQTMSTESSDYFLISVKSDFVLFSCLKFWICCSDLVGTDATGYSLN